MEAELHKTENAQFLNTYTKIKEILASEEVQNLILAGKAERLIEEQPIEEQWQQLKTRFILWLKSLFAKKQLPKTGQEVLNDLVAPLKDNKDLATITEQLNKIQELNNEFYKSFLDIRESFESYMSNLTLDQVDQALQKQAKLTNELDELRLAIDQKFYADLLQAAHMLRVYAAKYQKENPQASIAMMEQAEKLEVRIRGEQIESVQDLYNTLQTNSSRAKETLEKRRHALVGWKESSVWKQ